MTLDVDTTSGTNWSTVDFRLTWSANKPAFLGTGQCEVGIIQIVKTDSDYLGPTGVAAEYAVNKGWHLDGSPFYSHGNTFGPITDVLSHGSVGMQDQPGFQYSLFGAALYEGIQNFETCVVAAPQGGEALHSYSADGLEKMAVYGCVTWAAKHKLLPDGSYEIVRSLQGQSTGADDNQLDFTGAGDAPSGKFKSLVKQYYVPVTFPN